MSSQASLTTISTISLATIITFVALVAATPGPQGQQHPHQDQQQLQTQTLGREHNEELLRQLVRLTVEEEQQQQQQQQPQQQQLKLQQLQLQQQRNDNAQESSGQLKAMLDGVAGKQQKLAKQQQKKAALKRKWHKLVDDLIDESADKAEASGAELSAVNEPVARKRPLSASQQQQVSSFFQPPAQQPANDDSKLVILVKRKPDGGNGLGDLFASEASSQQLQQHQPARQPVNMEQHHRRILDDGFGVLRAAKITSNNHLGIKEMPKFGSEEEY